MYMYLWTSGVRGDSPMQINWQPLLTLASSDHGDDEEEDIDREDDFVCHHLHIT